MRSLAIINMFNQLVPKIALILLEMMLSISTLTILQYVTFYILPCCTDSVDHLDISSDLLDSGLFPVPRPFLDALSPMSPNILSTLWPS